MHVGFSGSQFGMSTAQILAVDKLIIDNTVTYVAHSGDCIGADKEFHELVKLRGLLSIGHPPIDDSKRAYCDFDEELPPEEYLIRNKIIVNSSNWMIFGPKGYKEELRSGTWSTVRYARKIKKNGFIVWPDGKTGDINGTYEG